MDWISELKRREFNLRPKSPPPPEADRYYFHEGSVPVLLSASHSTFHWRKGRYKHGEAFTAGFAQLVAEQSGAYALYPRFRQEDDPNFSAESPYKSRLRHIVETHHIQFVLDIHGCSNRHRVGLALGTINSASCPTAEPALCGHFEQQGWRRLPPSSVSTLPELRSDHYVVNLPRFAGGVRQKTTTQFAACELGVEAAQLEICSTLRVPLEEWGDKRFEGDVDAIEKTLKMLVGAVAKIKQAVWRPPVVTTPPSHVKG